MPNLKEITGFLDCELRINEFDDSSHNGLQVENSGKITKICCGVDASMEFFEAAQKAGADLLICHHGISWGNSLARISGLNYRRIKFLIDNDIALYACHLPLDAHPRYGNNVCIAKALGLQNLKPFGMYNGTFIGFEGRFDPAISYKDLKQLVAEITETSNLQSMDFGKDSISSLAVVSGGAAGEIEEAGRKGIDAYLSGEAGLVAYSLAQEYGINAIFAGHYATETFGVKSLGKILEQRFNITHEFIDFGIIF